MLSIVTSFVQLNSDRVSMFCFFVKILRAEVGQRLLKTPCALITSKFGWTGNMQRIIASQTHSKTQDIQRE